MFHYKLSLKYWGDCLLKFIYLINRFSSVMLNNISPFEKLYVLFPSYEHLKSFGCLCHAVSPSPCRNKLQPRSTSYVFLGYPYGKRGTNYSIFLLFPFSTLGMSYSMNTYFPFLLLLITLILFLHLLVLLVLRRF